MMSCKNNVFNRKKRFFLKLLAIISIKKWLAYSSILSIETEIGNLLESSLSTCFVCKFYG